MSLWQPEVLAVGIDSGTVAMLSGATLTIRAAAPSSPAQANSGEVDDPLANALRDLLSEVRPKGSMRRPRRIHALAGADLCRHWTLVPPEGVASLRELRAIATGRCCQLFGGRGEDWSIAGDWSLARPFVCAAIPAPTVRALQAVARGSATRLQIESCVLASISKLEPWLPAEGWTGWRSPSSVVLVLRTRGRTAWLQTQRHRQDSGADAMIEEAARQITRHCLRTGQIQPEAMTWLGAIDLARRGDAGSAGVPGGAVVVNTIEELPEWHRPGPGTGEAQWAATLAASH